ncbi:DUF2397 family protein [Deinococcus radiomollis]|uniref:DUF2397 family protein n=1 Tax=Deinococcus radiomollis TaxID=468916 RepID=UPI00389190EF
MLPALREFTYLTSPSASTYRALMRLFYEAHLAQRHTLPPEEVLAGLQGQLQGQLSGLTPEGLLLDLDVLVGWGNLGRRRDTRRVGSLAEYARRRDLYYASSRGLSIEGFLEAGLDAAEETVAVGAGIVSGLEARWESLMSMLGSGDSTDASRTGDSRIDDETEAAWAALQRDFLALSGDVRSLALNLERRLSLEALNDFLEFKEAVRAYVERLAGELAGPGRRLRDSLGRLTPEQETRLLGTVARVRAGRLTRGAAIMDAEQAARLARREWQALRGWFSRGAEQGDGLEYGVTALRGAVTRVLAFVDALHRTRELGLGRAGELAALAASLDRLPEAAARETLSVTLGLSAPLHAPGGGNGAEGGRAWTTGAEQVLLTAVQRGKVAERHSADVRETSREARRAARDALQAERERQKALLDLFQDGRLDLTRLDLSDASMLSDLLAWLSAGFSGTADPDSTEAVGGSVTAGPQGRQLRVTLTDTPATLNVPGGTLWIERGATMRLIDREWPDDRTAGAGATGNGAAGNGAAGNGAAGEVDMEDAAQSEDSGSAAAQVFP